MSAGTPPGGSLTPTGRARHGHARAPHSGPSPLSAEALPSRTARAAAIGRAVGFAGHRDAWAEQALPWRDAIVARRLRTGIGVDADPEGRRLLRGLLGGAVAHMSLRMRAIDEASRTALAEGIDQVVVLGAGLDTRAWRLTDLAGARVLELDLPELQEAKRRRLAGVGLRAREVRFVPADLHRADLDWILGDVGHDPVRPTLWIWESVAMYLPMPSVQATLEVLGARSMRGSVLAMTFAAPDGLGPGRLGRALSPAAGRLFDLLGEPMQTQLRDEEVTSRLHEVGFEAVTITDSAAWAAAVPTPMPRDPLGSERLVVARPAAT